MGIGGVAGNDQPKLIRYDSCQSPGYALDPLIDYLDDMRRRKRRKLVVWESAAGEGNLVKTLRHLGHEVIGTDLQKDHKDYFAFEPKHYDVQVTNPPWSLKYRWLARAYALKKPFALLVPVKTLGGATAQRLFDERQYEWLFLDKRINFKTPDLGYAGNGASFPVMWICSQVALDDEHTSVFFRQVKPHAYPWEKDLAASLLKKGKRHE